MQFEVKAGSFCLARRKYHLQSTFEKYLIRTTAWTFEVIREIQSIVMCFLLGTANQEISLITYKVGNQQQ